MQPNAFPASETITLGGCKYEVNPMTWGQLAVVMPSFVECARGMYSAEGSAALKRIFVAALGRDYPDFTEAFLDGLVVTPTEINAAADAIARVSGLVKPQGEAEAGVSP